MQFVDVIEVRVLGVALLSLMGFFLICAKTRHGIPRGMCVLVYGLIHIVSVVLLGIDRTSAILGGLSCIYLFGMGGMFIIMAFTVLGGDDDQRYFSETQY